MDRRIKKRRTYTLDEMSTIVARLLKRELDSHKPGDRIIEYSIGDGDDVGLRFTRCVHRPAPERVF
jgi:hypothetical protein